VTPRPEAERADIAIIGAGAAGLMAAIWAGRTLADSARKRAGATGRGRAKVIALDGAKSLGAKILVAGGGRCNVTHHAVDESAYAGSSRHAIKKVLRAFDVPKTVAFFAELGVELKREETGKLFPVSDDAHTVLDALLEACRRAGVELRHPWRVARVERVPLSQPPGGAEAEEPQFLITGPGEQVIAAHRLILATGGMALPRSGSDGAGYAFARALGHTVTPLVCPALVPLRLDEGHWVRELSGLTVWASVEVRAGTGKRLVSFTNSTLCTHFGLSGPSVLDASRYLTHARAADPAAGLVVNWLPGTPAEVADEVLLAARGRGGRSIVRVLTEQPWPPPAGPGAPREPAGLPERLARALCAAAGVDASTSPDRMTREQRRALVQTLTACPMSVTGDRGYTFAEVTAGGVPLAELDLATMHSRVCPGLHIIGELCDVDGRIGGFNFQWAWASGYLAGVATGRAASGVPT
jgi:predicted Rossmann fold flavoprotein